MSAYVHYEFTETDVAPLNRWAQPGVYSIQVTGGTWSIRSTLRRINQGETGNYQAFEVIDDTGASANSLALAAGTYKVFNFAAEAFECTKDAGVADDSVIIRQQGSSGG